MAGALRTAKRFLAQMRDADWEAFTIPPDRSFNHMNNDEKRAIRRYDRALAKINAALR